MKIMQSGKLTSTFVLLTSLLLSPTASFAYTVIRLTDDNGSSSGYFSSEVNVSHFGSPALNSTSFLPSYNNNNINFYGTNFANSGYSSYSDYISSPAYSPSEYI